MLELFKVSFILDYEEDKMSPEMTCVPGDLCKPDGCWPYRQPCPPFED